MDNDYGDEQRSRDEFEQTQLKQLIIDMGDADGLNVHLVPTYQAVKLSENGLIELSPSSRQYRLTEEGRRLYRLFTQF